MDLYRCTRHVNVHVHVKHTRAASTEQRTEHGGRQVGRERDGDEEALEEPDDHDAARAPAVRRHARYACVRACMCS